MLNIFVGASQPFGIPQLRILCLALYPIFNRVIWFSGVQLLEFFIYIGYYPPPSDLGLVKIFSQSVGCLFVLLTVSFALQKFCNFMRSHLLILDLTAQSYAVLFRNFSPVPIFLRLFHTFSSISFSVSGFMSSSLIHLDLSFVQGDKNGSISILLHDNSQLSQHHLLKMLSFFQLDGFNSFVKDQVSDHRCVGSFLDLQFYSIDLPVCRCTSTMQFLSQLLCSTA